MATQSPPDPAPFAATLRAVRARLALSQAEVAQRAGLTPSYLSMLESRRKPPPSDAVVRRLARALDMDPAFLLEIAHLERTPEDIRKRMAHLRRSLEVEKEVSHKILRGPWLEALWHFLARQGFADSSVETLRLSRKTRRLVRGLAREAGKTRDRDAFRTAGSEQIEALDAEDREELIEALPDITRDGSAPDPAGEGGVPVIERLGDDPAASPDAPRIPVPTELRTPRAFLWAVPDQDMYPRLELGDRLLLDPDATPVNGDLVAVSLDGRDTVRTFLELPGAPELRATNTSVPPHRVDEESVRVIAVARLLVRGLGRGA